MKKIPIHKVLNIINMLSDEEDCEPEVEALHQRLIQLWTKVPYKDLGHKQYYACVYYPNRLCKNTTSNVSTILPTWELPHELAELTPNHQLNNIRYLKTNYNMKLYANQLLHHLGYKVQCIPVALDTLASRLAQRSKVRTELSATEQQLLKTEDTFLANAFEHYLQFYDQVPWKDNHSYFLNEDDIETLCEVANHEEFDLYARVRGIKFNAKTHIGIRLPWIAEWKPPEEQEFEEILNNVVTDLRKVVDVKLQNFLVSARIMSRSAYQTKP